jgi:hypothetical protein
MYEVEQNKLIGEPIWTFLGNWELAISMVCPRCRGIEVKVIFDRKSSAIDYSFMSRVVLFRLLHH